MIVVRSSKIMLIVMSMIMVMMLMMSRYHHENNVDNDFDELAMMTMIMHDEIIRMMIISHLSYIENRKTGEALFEVLPNSLLQCLLTFQIMQDGAWEWDLVCNVMTCMTAYSDAIFLGKIIVLMTIKKFCLAKEELFVYFSFLQRYRYFFP